MLGRETVFKLSQKALKKKIKKELSEMGYPYISDKGFVYAEGMVPVLLVAHLDTVHKNAVKTICKSDDDNVWMSPEGIGGDDRCGVYMALTIARDLKCHLLFCEDEEIGGVGAKEFVNSGINADVNYIIEFDRRGANDAVFYDCDNDEFTSFVERFGFKESWGSFSDISILAPHLGVAAVNLSSGYHNAHQTHEYVVWSEVYENIQRAMMMIETETEKFKYVERECYTYKYSGYDYGRKYSYSYGSGWGDVYDLEWEVDISPFRGSILFDNNEVIDTDFSSNQYYIDKWEELYMLSPCGKYAILLGNCIPMLHDGVTTGYTKSKSIKMTAIEYWDYKEMVNIA